MGQRERAYVLVVAGLSATAFAVFDLVTGDADLWWSILGLIGGGGAVGLGISKLRPSGSN